MSRRRRGSSDSWYRRKAESEAFMQDLQRRISERAALHPLIVGHVRAGFRGMNDAILRDKP